jgi:hypothetical protein
MQLMVLAVPECPNAPVLSDRLAAALDGRAGASVSHQVISDEGEAVRWGMHGSPTLLIDGVDPFAGPVAIAPGHRRRPAAGPSTSSPPGPPRRRGQFPTQRSPAAS